MDGNSIFKLSSELVMLIMQGLNPVDIVALRAVCHMFHRSAASRSVWIAALDRACEQHGIFKPTYPTEKMTLAELEHAASGPHRFVRFVNEYDYDGPKSDTEAYMKRRISCRKRISDAEASDGLYSISKLYLIPGGRFLVTATPPTGGGAAGSLCLWDLGFNAHSPAKVFPLAAIQLDNIPTGLTACPSFQDSPTSLDVMVATRLPTHQGAMAIYRVDPLASNPLFLPQTTVNLDTRLFFHSTLELRLDGPMAIIQSEACVGVWNWVKGTGCEWRHNALPLPISVCSRTVFTLDPNLDFMIYDIPDNLSPLTTNNCLPKVSNIGKCIRRRKEGGDTPSISLAATSGWQRHTQAYICTVIDEDDSAECENRLVLYAVRPVGGQDTSFLPAHIPVEGCDSEYVSSCGQPITDPVSPLILCDDRLVLCSRSNANELIATVLPVPKQASGMTIFPPSAILVNSHEVEDDDNLHSDNVGFCPMSGRVVHTVDNTSLHIVDFLLPLEEW